MRYDRYDRGARSRASGASVRRFIDEYVLPDELASKIGEVGRAPVCVQVAADARVRAPPQVTAVQISSNNSDASVRLDPDDIIVQVGCARVFQKWISSSPCGRRVRVHVRRVPPRGIFCDRWERLPPPPPCGRVSAALDLSLALRRTSR